MTSPRPDIHRLVEFNLSLRSEELPPELREALARNLIEYLDAYLSDAEVDYFNALSLRRIREVDGDEVADAFEASLAEDGLFVTPIPEGGLH